MLPVESMTMLLTKFLFVLPYFFYKRFSSPFSSLNLESKRIGDFILLYNSTFFSETLPIEIELEHSYYYYNQPLNVFCISSDYNDLTKILKDLGLIEHDFEYNARKYSFLEDLSFSVENLNKEKIYLYDPNSRMSLSLEPFELKFDVDFVKPRFISDVEEAKRGVLFYFWKYFDNINLNNIVLFSGGVDSSTIALVLKQRNANVSLYTLAVEGMQNKDLEHAKKVAEFLNIPLNVVTVSVKDVENAIPELIRVIHTRNPVKVEVGLVSYLILKRLNFKGDVWTGLGSEEIFAGYTRHVPNPFIESFNGYYNIYHRDVDRDYSIVKHFQLNPKLPFLDPSLVKFSLGISGSLKIKDEVKKYIFRLVAQDLGLGEFAFRKKLAAQYGSSISKAMEKITKAHGFRYKRDFLYSLDVVSD